METESSTRLPSRKPRTWLLVVLGIVVVALVVAMNQGGSADPELPASNPRRPQQTTSGGDKLDPKALDVRLEALKEPLPVPDKTGRNPFRFQPKAPPAPPSPAATRKQPVDVAPSEPSGPPQPVGPPPIPLKFIGVIDTPRVGKVAALTDCRHTMHGVEGEIIEGRYRIVKIGVESLVIEYTDGRGRTTLRMSGQECIGKV